MRDKLLSPKGQLSWVKKLINPIMNNRGEAGGEGAGAGEGAGEGAGAGAATLTPDWRENLDVAIKDHPSLADFKTPADLAKSYVNVQPLIGKEKIPMPGKDSDPMAEGGNPEWDTVYDRMGRPSDPAAYELPQVQVAQGMPEVPEETLKGFKELSHKIGLLPHQVKALYQWQHDQAVGGFTQATETRTQELQTSETALRKEFGQAFDANLQGARGLIAKFGGDEMAQVLEQTGLGNNPSVIKFLVNISKQFGEDGNALQGDAVQGNILTPQEADSEIKKIQADKKHAYWNNSDPEHSVAVKRMQDLFAMAFPGKQ